MPTLYTIGHSTRPLSELVAMLREPGLTLLADVRKIPRSRTNPQFNIDSLQEALPAAGIAYRHFAALGGRRGTRGDTPSHNTLWRHQSFRNYADYAETDAFRAALDELERQARERPTVIMCAEAVWWRCHRRLIADYLLARGWDVVHLMAPGRREPASLTAGAIVRRDGSVAYPERADS